MELKKEGQRGQGGVTRAVKLGETISGFVERVLCTMKSLKKKRKRYMGSYLSG
jgi:hypothetical protein